MSEDRHNALLLLVLFESLAPNFDSEARLALNPRAVPLAAFQQLSGFSRHQGLPSLRLFLIPRLDWEFHTAAMRSSRIPWHSVPSAALLLLSYASLSSASPFPREALQDSGYAYLLPRDCETYCGADSQICCGGGEVCQTQAGMATCVAGGGGGGGGWGPIGTTTWTETHTYTSTLMTHWEPAPEPTEGVDCVPKNDQQEACGNICCAGWQTCAHEGQCSAKPGYDEPSTIVVTEDGKTTTQYSAPYRITTTVVSSGISTRTETATDGITGTASETGQATETADGSVGGGAGGGDGGGGLSGGAIAGIVIGSIVGAMLILFIAFCCIARGLWKACFGGGRKKETVDIYDERYSRHGSRPPPERHSGWFGMGGGRRSSSHGSEKKSGGKKWLGLAGLAATLFALLNFKKDKKPARKPASRYSGSYYSYSDGTSPSEFIPRPPCRGTHSPDTFRFACIT